MREQLGKLTWSMGNHLLYRHHVKLEKWVPLGITWIYFAIWLFCEPPLKLSIALGNAVKNLAHSVVPPKHGSMTGIPILAQTQQKITKIDDENLASSILHGSQWPLPSFEHKDLAFKHAYVIPVPKLMVLGGNTFASAEPEMYEGQSLGLLHTGIHYPPISQTQTQSNCNVLQN